MIDPQWQVTDLDPITWRNLGPYLEPQRYIAAAQPGEHGLFVLHHGGALLNVVDTHTRATPSGVPANIADPVALAQDLYARGLWDRVHVIDRRHLARVAQQAQATPNRALTLDAYYHLVSTLFWGNAQGYACVPPRPGNWNGWTYEDIRRVIAAIDAPATLALGVYADDALAIGLILVCEQGQIRQVTTFEGLAWEVPSPGPTPSTLATLSEALSAQYAPPVAVLLCTEVAFAGWLAAADKQAYLSEARQQATAIWLLEADRANQSASQEHD
jgi:hypothetical protein